MSVNRIKRNNAYGLVNAIQDLTPQPIIAKRNPTTSDRAELGTLWINELTNAYYIATSIVAGSTTWQAQQTGAGVFAAVNVTGPAGTTLAVTADTDLGGTLTVGGATDITGNLTVTGNVAITGDFDLTNTLGTAITSTLDAPQAIYLHANGGVTETIELHSDLGTGLNSINILSDVGGVLVTSTGKADNKAINLVSSAGGFQLDGVLTSALNVTGAGEDLQLNSTGGSIALTATEASATAVSLTASDAAGKVAIVGVGGITAATTNAAIAITSGTGAVTISGDATANSLNLGTGAGIKAVAIGSATGASTVKIEAGTAAAGSIHIGQSANAVPIVIGNVTGATGVTINSGTSGIAMASTGAGDISIASSDTVLIDAVGVLELNSSGAAIGIGNDANAFGVNIGTGAAARPVIVGNATAGTTLTLNTPAATPVVATNGLSVTTATAGITLPGPITIRTGAGVPANGLAVNVGDIYINTTSAAAGTRMYIATAAGAWTNVSMAA